MCGFEGFDEAAKRIAREEKMSLREELEKEKYDAVNRPAHYLKGGIECIDVIEAATADLKGIEAVCTANIIKYIFRWKDKNGKTDVEKCRWYCNKLIGVLEKRNVKEKD